MSGAWCGVLFTVVILVLAVRGAINARQEGRRVKAVLLGIVAVLLALLCATGGYLGFGAGIGVDNGPTNNYCPVTDIRRC